jgi:serine/threonine-protein kinase RsbW
MADERRGNPPSRERFEVTGSLRSIAGAAERLDAFAAANDVPFEGRWPFHVALDEVLSNIVKYGFGGEDDRRRIEVELSMEHGVLTMTVSDDAPAFDPRQAPEPDTTTPLEQRRIGGLGITIVKGLMDSIDYERRGGRNILVLRKRVDTPGPA